jgi:HemY protein
MPSLRWPARSIVRGLAIDLLNGAYDVAQLQRAWRRWSRPSADARGRDPRRAAPGRAARRRAPGARLAAAVWEAQATLGDSLRVKLVLRAGGRAWTRSTALAGAHRGGAARNPRDANLQYLAGMACMKRQLWGKAQQLLTQAAWACRTRPAPQRLARAGGAG